MSPERLEPPPARRTRSHDEEGKDALTLGSVLPAQRLPDLDPDLPLEVAIRHINEFSIIPVVNRANLRQLEGVITQDSVFSSYRTDTRTAE